MENNKNNFTNSLDKTNKNIGVFVGKFLPPHIGHTSQIEKCLSLCDTLFVVVADSKKRSRELCKNAEIDFISPKKRLIWLKSHFKNFKNIKFFLLDQGMLEAYPNYLENWKHKFLKLFKTKPSIWFVDKNYKSISEQYFPEFEFVGFDRNQINISSTLLRSSLSENLNYIIPEAKNFFKKYIEK